MLNPVWLFCDFKDCSLTDSFVHGILQARILEWVAISFSRGSSWPRDQNCTSCISRQILYHWAKCLQIGELDHKEGWALKDWCLRITVLEKTLESPLDSKEIKPVNPKGNQTWIFTGRTVAKALILWPLIWKADSLEKIYGKDWGQEEKRVTEDEMLGWHQLTQCAWVNLSKLWEIVKDREAWCAVDHGVAKSGTWLSDWTTMIN